MDIEPPKTAFDTAQQMHWATTVSRRSYDHPVVQAFALQRVAFIERLLGDFRPGSALEVGCGDGFGMWHMRRIVSSVSGCDISDAMLQANPMGASVLRRADAHNLPYADGSFDLVYCWELLHHVGDPLQVVREMARVASRRVLLCEPNCLNPAMALFGLLYGHERGLLSFPPWRTSRLMRRAGLTNVRSAVVCWFTPNNTPSWLAWLLLRLPYRVPLLGLHTITVGERSGA
jgi:ubiquinone/menaquinone biosynthesis C-methylase UbiE